MLHLRLEMRLDSSECCLLAQVVFGAGPPVQGGYAALQRLSLQSCSGCVPLSTAPPLLRVLHIAECDDVLLHPGFMAGLERLDVRCEIFQAWQVHTDYADDVSDETVHPLACVLELRVLQVHVFVAMSAQV
jgi:hypothetical protein